MCCSSSERIMSKLCSTFLTKSKKRRKSNDIDQILGSETYQAVTRTISVGIERIQSPKNNLIQLEGYDNEMKLDNMLKHAQDEQICGGKLLGRLNLRERAEAACH